MSATFTGDSTDVGAPAGEAGIIVRSAVITEGPFLYQHDGL